MTPRSRYLAHAAQPAVQIIFRYLASGLLFLISLGDAAFPAVEAEEAVEIAQNNKQVELIGHWPLRDHVRDISPSNLRTVAQGLRFAVAEGPPGTLAGAIFDGHSSRIDIPDGHKLALGTEPFSISLWTETDDELADSLGDLISCYDPNTRTGLNFGIYSHGGVTSAQPNSRQLHLGIDQSRLESEFMDHGRLGDAVYIFSLCVHDGRLYAATCHAGANQAGRVFRFEGGDRWTDLGSPGKANAISAMAVFAGNLYVATSKYRLAGSSLAESENIHRGGEVYRLTAADAWESCGTLSGETEATAALVVFRGRLYATSLYRPAGFFRYEGGDQWTPLATPDGKRPEALHVFNGAIYATCYDEGSVFRFDGQAWQTVGVIPEATQTYGFGVYRGQLHVSEWPKARVFRYLGGTQWTDTGKLGEELEAMPLLVYNGKLYCGTLPSAAIYRHDGDHAWTQIAQVDRTPDVKYRRAWSMAVFQGRLFVGTLPSGHVLSIEAGKNVTYDSPLGPGRHHLAAVRSTDALRLYVDGQQVAESKITNPSDYNLNGHAPLSIGFGAQDFFRGIIADVRLFRGELTAPQVQRLHNRMEWAVPSEEIKK